MNFHKLLRKQLKKCLPEEIQRMPELERFLNVVNDSYNSFDRDKELAERAFKISEEEYADVTQKLKKENEVKKTSVDTLKKTLGIMTDGQPGEQTDDLLLITRYLGQQVSKRKNAEQVFSSLIQNLQSGILLEDETRHIVLANRLFCDMFSIPVPPEALQGADCSTSAEDTKHLFDNPETFVTHISHILSEKKLVTGEVLELVDGRVFERNYIPIFIEEKYKGHLWTYTEITQRKKALDALAKSEQTNRMILNASLDAIVIADKQGAISYWNPQAEKIFGWPETEITGKLLSETIIPEQFRKAHLMGLNHYNKTGEGPVLNKIIEVVAVNKNNEHFPAELSIVPITDNNGSLFCGFIRDISERKKAETELKASRELWQFALEGAGDGVWEYNFENKEVFFSRQYKKMLGYEEDEFDNKPGEWLSRIHPDDLHIITETDQEYFENKIRSHQREYRIQHKNGDYLWILDRGMVVSYTEYNKPKRIVGTHTNITQRKEEEEEYKRISVVASANENGVLFTNHKGKITWSNEGFAKLTGYTKTEIEGKTPVQLCGGPLTDSAAYQQMLTSFYEGNTFNVEIVLYKKDRNWFWGRVTGQAITGLNGKTIQYFAIIEDITHEKEFEQAVKINEEKYRNIIANINLGLLEVDNDELIQFANQSFCDMCGYTTEELLGKKASGLFVKGENLDFIEQKKELRKTGLSDAYEISIKNKRGEVKWWLVSGAPRYNDKGELVGSIGIHLDITDQKILEIELTEARRQAEFSSSAKQSFLANMSHEIRTPMNAILGMSRLLQKTELNDQQGFYLKTIYDAAEHLLVVINDILDISKIEAGKLTLEQIGFRTEDIMKKALRVMQHRAEEKGLSLVNMADPDVANILLGDPYRLNQVLLNLLSNAIKFSEKGTICLSSKLVRVENNKQWVELAVSDNGIGMEKEFLDSLFESFSQEDRSVSRKYGGTGLGMAISKQLVELMGGNIRVESEKGKGTTVTLRICFCKGDEANVPPKEIQHTGRVSLKGKKILLVEDNEMNRLVATTTLNHYGALITEVGNGAEAVETLKHSFFDLVLMDVQMPVMDGMEASRLIRKELNLAVPIIALTANAIKGENEKCLTAGMNDYVSKPFEEEELVNVMAKWLNMNSIIPGVAQKNSTAVPSEKLYNLSALITLGRGNEAFVKKMIGLFSEQAPAAVSGMKEALVKNDFASIKSIAHRIKPSIDNLEILAIKQDIRMIETLAIENKPSAELVQLVQKVEQVINTVVEDLKREAQSIHKPG